MKILIFIARIALICNICFLLAEGLRYATDLDLNPFYSTIIILGYCSIFLNIILAIAVIALLARSKHLLKLIPRWLLIINFLFLIFQLFIFPA